MQQQLFLASLSASTLTQCLVTVWTCPHHLLEHHGGPTKQGSSKICPTASYSYFAAIHDVCACDVLLYKLHTPP